MISGNYCKKFIDGVVGGVIDIPETSGVAIYYVCEGFQKLRHACFGVIGGSGRYFIPYFCEYL